MLYSNRIYNNIDLESSLEGLLSFLFSNKDMCPPKELPINVNNYIPSVNFNVYQIDLKRFSFFALAEYIREKNINNYIDVDILLFPEKYNIDKQKRVISLGNILRNFKSENRSYFVSVFLKHYRDKLFTGLFKCLNIKIDNILRMNIDMFETNYIESYKKLTNCLYYLYDLGLIYNYDLNIEEIFTIKNFPMVIKAKINKDIIYFKNNTFNFPVEEFKLYENDISLFYKKFGNKIVSDVKMFDDFIEYKYVNNDKMTNVCKVFLLTLYNYIYLKKINLYNIKNTFNIIEFDNLLNLLLRYNLTYNKLNYNNEEIKQLYRKYIDGIFL